MLDLDVWTSDEFGALLVVNRDLWGLERLMELCEITSCGSHSNCQVSKSGARIGLLIVYCITVCVIEVS